MDVDETLGAALAAVRAKRFVECEGLCRQVLGIDPANTRAKTMAAISLGQLGRHEEAIQLLREALEVDPNGLEQLNYLALYLRASGRLDEALDASQRLISLAPDRMEGHYGLGLGLLDQRRFMEAAGCFERAAQINPKVSLLQTNLGVALRGAGQLSQAEKAFRKAIELEPGNRVAQGLLTQILVDANRGKEAAQLLRRAHEQDPSSYFGLMSLATALLEDSDPFEAAEILKKAVEVKPDSADALLQLGSTLQQLGRFQEAASSLRRAIELDPDSTRAYYELAYCIRFADSDRPLLDRLESIKHRPDLKATALANVHYAIGKGRDELGEYEKAMEEVEAANAIMLETTRSRYNPAEQDAVYDRAKRLYESGFMDRFGGAGSVSDLPVFIVGMIRSGTTLTEQILSSHPSIGAGGEQMFWLDGRIGSVHSAAPAAGRERLGALANDYLEVLGKTEPGKLRVTDKQPLNYGHLGMIHVAFPNAKIIHCRRNPADTCLSIFFTPFRAGLTWGHDKERITGAYRNYLRMMDLWRSVLPSGSVLDIDYEELVTDREPVARRMIEFLGLEWDDACLSPEANPRAVATPSMWQVRQPIYTRSLARWRNYEPWLGPFRDLLTDNSPAPG